MDGTFERCGNLAVDYNGKTYNSLGERFRVCDVILIHARHACGLTELNCNLMKILALVYLVNLRVCLERVGREKCGIFILTYNSVRTRRFLWREKERDLLIEFWLF